MLLGFIFLFVHKYFMLFLYGAEDSLQDVKHLKYT